MGDNLLLMDSPVPRAKASGLASRPAPRELTSTQTESPCGVDKLLNFSPSKLNEVKLDGNDVNRTKCAFFWATFLKKQGFETNFIHF